MRHQSPSLPPSPPSATTPPPTRHRSPSPSTRSCFPTRKATRFSSDNGRRFPSPPFSLPATTRRRRKSLLVRGRRFSSGSAVWRNSASHGRVSRGLRGVSVSRAPRAIVASCARWSAAECGCAFPLTQVPYALRCEVWFRLSGGCELRSRWANDYRQMSASQLDPKVRRMIDHVRVLGCCDAGYSADLSHASAVLLGRVAEQRRVEGGGEGGGAAGGVAATGVAGDQRAARGHRLLPGIQPAGGVSAHCDDGRGEGVLDAGGTSAVRVSLGVLRLESERGACGRGGDGRGM